MLTRSLTAMEAREAPMKGEAPGREEPGIGPGKFGKPLPRASSGHLCTCALLGTEDIND